ncbi:MAG: hypothetical protein KGO53_11555 [Alphaproteobacteria bacterium]|nr:hypothetical protein [Alphaproteobacteria bacterium]
MCSDLAWQLRNEGFNNVRALRCSGPTFIYSAWRRGEKVRVYISPISGRIRKIVPAY